jgi:hypothetical protein
MVIPAAHRVRSIALLFSGGTRGDGADSVAVSERG